MKISQIPSLLETAHKAGISVFLKGAPGTAKTAAVRQYANKTKLRLVHIHAPLTDALDIRGLPVVDNGEAKFQPLNIWPGEKDAPVVVLIDELPQCVPAIQNAYSQLLIDMQLGDVKLPKGHSSLPPVIAVKIVQLPVTSLAISSTVSCMSL